MNTAFTLPQCTMVKEALIAFHADEVVKVAVMWLPAGKYGKFSFDFLFPHSACTHKGITRNVSKLLFFRWYRGLVLAVDSTSAEVNFVDYGDTEWVPKSSVQCIHPSLLQV